MSERKTSGNDLKNERNKKLLTAEALSDDEFPLGGIGYLKHLVFLTRKGALTRAVKKIRNSKQHDPGKESSLLAALELLYRKYPNEPKE